MKVERRRGAVHGIAGRLERVYAVLKVRETAGRPQEVPGARRGTQRGIILDSSMVEHSAVNRRVVGSSPTRGAFKAGVFSCFSIIGYCNKSRLFPAST